jgi:ribosomal protein L11 methyltransferase
MSGTKGKKGTKKPAATKFLWRKLSPAKWEDVWQERLGWLGQRLVLFVMAGYKTLRIEAHQLSRAEADGLVKEFGGQIREAKALSQKDLEPEPRPPLNIADKLVVIGQAEDRGKFGKTPTLLIPASMAFGTGEHATTATCLRVLCAVTKSLTPHMWDALDLGTGSGILGFAARQFGARKVEACDFDPLAIRVARENAKLNAIKGVTFRRLDVLQWRPERKWPVVLANVYGPILIEAASQIARAVEAGGVLIISGILREQAEDVMAAFRAQKLTFERVVRKGKWVTAVARKAGGVKRASDQRRAVSKRMPKKTSAVPKTRSSQEAKRVLRKVRRPRSAK